MDIQTLLGTRECERDLLGRAATWTLFSPHKEDGIQWYLKCLMYRASVYQLKEDGLQWKFKWNY